MRIESVTAVAFGPFVKETLDLAPGLTVVHGDNESGKSTWHAATYASLCGRRRGRGALRKDDEEFRDQHRPWGGDCWQARCVVVLDDGRRVELWHDLDDLVDCGAKDLALGDDLAGEIMHDGAPDGSRWLGLDRRTFAATAVVNQGELARVVHSAKDLQQDLQRAAATAGRDETAASALAALKEFRSARVGLDRAGTTKPLRKAKLGLEDATRQLERARAEHADYLHLVTAADAARQEADDATEDAKSAEAAWRAAGRLVEAVRSAGAAAGQAAALQQRVQELHALAQRQQARLRRARELVAEVGEDEPAGGPADDERARSVTAAVAAWRAAPAEPRLSGPSAAHLEAELARLPEDPTGDLAPAADLCRIRRTLDESATVLAATERRRPPDPQVTDTSVRAAVEAGPDVLGRLADRLAAETPALDPALPEARDAAAADRSAALAELAVAERDEAAALESFRAVAAGTTSHSGAPGLVPVILSAGTALAVAGVLLLVLGQAAAAIIALVLGAAGLAAGFALRRGPSAAGPVPRQRSLKETRQRVAAARARASECERRYAKANARFEAAQADHAAALARRQAAVADAAARGLPLDPQALRVLAARAAEIATQREALDRWQQQHDSDRRAKEEAEERLAEALQARGYDGPTEVLDAWAAYERDCAAAARQAALAARRPDLQRRLADRQDAERRAVEARDLRRRALAELAAAARAVGLTLPEPAALEARANDLAHQLRRWLEQRSAALAATDEQRARWQELRALLDGGSLAELAAAVAAADQQAEAARSAAQRAARDAAARRQEVATAAAAEGAAGDVDETTAGALLTEREATRDSAARREQELREIAAQRDGQVVERGAAIPSVAEAEEAVEEATRELDRVRALDRVLELTTAHLEKAQRNVFVAIAPVLGATLTRWLPRVTSGRYLEALVHPENLRVQVRDASRQWREANLLSVGTAEQIYLLLRVALAEHLASAATVSPLLLDDVTVQADPTRTVAILEMCKALAEDGRQVVLFAQESAVAEWAEQHLTEPEHRVVHLDVVPVG